jgi:hypothetical protein
MGQVSNVGWTDRYKVGSRLPMTKRIGPITLDGDTADRITVLNLKEYRGYLKKELAEWKKNPRTDTNPAGYWLHPEDVANNTRVIEALNTVIKHFGE